MQHFDLILSSGEALLFNETAQTYSREVVDIGVLNGKIAAIKSRITEPAAQTISLQGLTVLPGVIDSQVHFREPGLTHKEDLETGTRAAVLGGVTSIFEMPNTQPSTTTAESFQQKLDLAKNRAHCNYAFFIGACQENSSELPQLEKQPHCAGVKIFLGASFGSLLVDNDLVFEDVMRNGRRRLTIHSEDEARLRERKSIALESGHVRSHHIWRDEESALISTRKSIALAEKYQRPVHMLHISSAEEMAFLSQHKNICTVEMLPQFLTLSAPDCYERLGTLAQQNPPIRDIRHLEKLWQAVAQGVVDIIGSDHAPHTLEEKSKPYPQSPSGFPGVQTLLPIMLNHVHQKKLSLEHLTQLITENPCRHFKVKNKGRIALGFDADFTVVDLKKQRTIENKWIASKCGYTPFDGMSVTGWPTHTIINGQVVMQEDTVLHPHSGSPIEFNI